MGAAALRAQTLNAGRGSAQRAAAGRRHACKVGWRGPACMRRHTNERCCLSCTNLHTAGKPPAAGPSRHRRYGGPGSRHQPPIGWRSLPAATQAVSAGACGGRAAAGAAAATAPCSRAVRGCRAAQQVPCARAGALTQPTAQRQRQWGQWEQAGQPTWPRAAGSWRQASRQRQAAPQQGLYSARPGAAPGAVAAHASTRIAAA